MAFSLLLIFDRTPNHQQQHLQQQQAAPPHQSGSQCQTAHLTGRQKMPRVAGRFVGLTSSGPFRMMGVSTKVTTRDQWGSTRAGSTSKLSPLHFNGNSHKRSTKFKTFAIFPAIFLPFSTLYFKCLDLPTYTHRQHFPSFSSSALTRENLILSQAFSTWRRYLWRDNYLLNSPVS